MIVTVNSQRLATELRLLNKVVPTKPAIAILSHALLTASKDGLNLYATDFEVGLSMECPARVEQPGAVALPVAKFLALVEQFPDADVSIAEDKQVFVKCGAFKSKLQAMPVADFPPPPKLDGAAYTLDAAQLKQLIAKTRYAINPTTSKFVLQGALLTLAGAVGAMVTTDSKRLALATMGRSGPDASLIIPMKALDMVSSFQEGHDVEVTIGTRHLSFASGGRTLTSRTIEGQFPAYERIIPRDNANVATVSTAALTAALRRMVLVSEDNRAIHFTIADGSMELATSSAEVGSASEQVAVQYIGQPMKVCANGGYVLDFLDATTNPTVTMALKDPKGAMLLSDGDDHIAVIMLMRA